VGEAGAEDAAGVLEDAGVAVAGADEGEVDGPALAVDVGRGEPAGGDAGATGDAAGDADATGDAAGDADALGDAAGDADALGDAAGDADAAGVGEKIVIWAEAPGPAHTIATASASPGHRRLSKASPSHARSGRATI
jgi:hypothetical protein